MATRFPEAAAQAAAAAAPMRANVPQSVAWTTSLAEVLYPGDQRPRRYMVPSLTTNAIFVVLWMSTVGSALSTTRSARIPGAIVPRVAAWPAADAPIWVAARIASTGV